ncbi:hypothetical protein BJX62DRAFT_235315 [Aspergillus germanicus]
MERVEVLSKPAWTYRFLQSYPTNKDYFDRLRIHVDRLDRQRGEQVPSKVFRTPHTEEQAHNLYQSMAKIIVSLAKVPQPRIGSWTISDDGRLNLSNRPLFHLQELENLNIPSGVPRNTTYTSADTFCLDILDGHDNCFRYQANAAFDENDAKSQAVDLVFMRSTLSQITDRSLRDGQFVMHLTDMHMSNIFVEKDWNIKHLIDPEWACSVPLEHALALHWLTDKGVDEPSGAEYEKFEKHYRLLTDAIRKQETSALIQYNGNEYSLATTMDRVFDNRHYWMPLQDLPNELLLLIWDFFEPREMNVLILTCWQFHDTFNNLLY